MDESEDYYCPKTSYYLDGLDETIEEIDISNYNLEGVLDLEKFKNLKQLNCKSNEFTKIIGLEPSITDIDCSNNLINHIDLSQAINLELLNIHNNDLVNLNLTKTTKLKTLDISSNELVNLDLSNTLVEFPKCSFNKLTKLIPPKVPCEISCEYNNLESIDNFTDNVYYINCSNNQITHINKLPENLIGLNLENNKIIQLPEQYPPNLKSLGLVNCGINGIKNLPDSLEVCYINNNQIISDKELRKKFYWVRFY